MLPNRPYPRILAEVEELDGWDEGMTVEDTNQDVASDDEDMAEEAYQ